MGPPRGSWQGGGPRSCLAAGYAGGAASLAPWRPRVTTVAEFSISLPGLAEEFRVCSACFHRHRSAGLNATSAADGTLEPLRMWLLTGLRWFPVTDEHVL
jgi:hypothetical protein